MASVTMQKGAALPDNAAKTDFYNLVDGATGTVTGITASDIASNAGIVGTQLSATAGILGTQLESKIDDTGKISGKAFTELANIPSGAGAIPIANMASGTILQQKFIKDSTGQTLTGVTPLDNTKPQKTEGDTYTALNTAITPTAANNIIIVEAFAPVYANAGIIIASILKDTDADSIGSSINKFPATGYGPLYVSTSLVAPSTTAITFKLMTGVSSAGTYYLNTDSGGDTLGGLLYSWLRVTEVKA